MSKIFLFLDDDAFHPEKIRNPEVYYPLIGAENVLSLMLDYEVVKFINVEQSQEYIEKNGCPNFISFDNDLMMKLEGVDLAKWIVEKDMENPGFIPKDFQYFVHSQNPIAKERIYSYLNQYLEYIGLNIQKTKKIKL
jgi:hypothetical protein